MSSFKIALIQSHAHEDGEGNLKQAISSVENACSLGADVVCFPELFLTGYFCQTEDTSCFDLAEPIPGPTTDRFCREAKKRKVFILCPLFERRAPGVYHNSVVLVGPEGEIHGVYRKMHIPDDPGWFEKFYFTPGDTGFLCFAAGRVNISALICWDQWFPEAARIVSLKGAEIIFYPTAIGWRADEDEQSKSVQLEAWKTVQRAHAISNGIYVATANRVGFEHMRENGGGINFWGNSFVCNPEGVVISEASGDKEEIILADIDIGKIEQTRRNWPFLRDRRIDTYSEIQQRFIDNDSKNRN